MDILPFFQGVLRATMAKGLQDIALIAALAGPSRDLIYAHL